MARRANIGERWGYINCLNGLHFIAEIVYDTIGYHSKVVQVFNSFWRVGQICRDPEEFLECWIKLEGQHRPVEEPCH